MLISTTGRRVAMPRCTSILVSHQASSRSPTVAGPLRRTVSTCRQTGRRRSSATGRHTTSTFTPPSIRPGRFEDSFPREASIRAQRFRTRSTFITRPAVRRSKEDQGVGRSVRSLVDLRSRGRCELGCHRERHEKEDGQQKVGHGRRRVCDREAPIAIQHRHSRDVTELL
jgi:hypothetical protein